MREVPSSSTYIRTHIISIKCKSTAVYKYIHTYVPQQFSHTAQESGLARELRTSSFSDDRPISESRSVEGGTMTSMMPSSRASVTSWLASSLLRASQCTCQTSPIPSCMQQVVCTDSWPNIVAWDRSAITIIEQTVPFELCVDSAVAGKIECYAELLGTCRCRLQDQPACTGSRF